MSSPRSDYFTSQTLTGLILILLGTVSVTAAIYHALPRSILLVDTSQVYILGIFLIFAGLLSATFRLEPSLRE